MSVAADQNQAAAGGEPPRYAFKPSLVGAASEFVLMADALEWQIGRRSGRVRYDQVRSVRMLFRPITMQSHRFVTDIRSPGNPRIQISSVSWRSLMEQERLDAPYTAFITELHRRLAAARSSAQFAAGMPAIPYWFGVVVFAGIIVATVVMIARGIQVAQWSGAIIVGVFFVVFALQLGNFFRRNWPVRYRPDALPDMVLPK